MVDRADAAEAEGAFDTAHHLLEQAQRLAPNDRAITMAIGRVRLARGDPRASEPLELVARLEDLRDAWLLLAAVRHRFGFPQIARDELNALLHRQAPPDGPAFAALIGAVVEATGAPGWCGLVAAGTLRFGLAEGRARRGLRVMLDEVRVPVPRAGGSITLPDGWQSAQKLSLTHDGQELIGSPIRPHGIAQVEGFVAARDGGLEGWAWQPGDPDHAPRLRLVGAGGTLPWTADLEAAVEHPRFGARPRGFRVDAASLAAAGLADGAVTVIGGDGRPLYGSPLDPGMERRSAAAAVEQVRQLFPADASPPAPHVALPTAGIPAMLVGAAPAVAPQRDRGVDVVIPVYRGVEETLACINSVRAGLPRGARIVVVEDRAPEPAMRALLDSLAARKRIVLHRLARNRGFPGAANEGIRLAAGRDVVLLNSDTLVPPGWLERLRAAAYAAADIGSVTPLSNDATIMSYPRPNEENPVPDLAATVALDRLAAASGAETVELPSGIGFCMYLRRDCLDQVGGLREDVFGQGYGEENDWCLRASAVGWRHLGLPTLFVGHVGGRSFGAAKGHLIARNLEVLERLHPGYERLIHDWVARDPMAPARRLIDLARWRAAAVDAGAVILVTHRREGGVKRRVAERAAAIRAQGQRPIVIMPARLGPDFVCQLHDGDPQTYPNLRFALPAQWDELLALLRADRPVELELHHFIGHHPDMLSLPEALGVPCEVVLHDYSWFCPRINLVGPGDRYCGEPDLMACETCVRDRGTTIDETITPSALVARSAARLASASRVIAPSPDTARRYRRHFPKIRPEPVAWEPPVENFRPPVPRADPKAAIRVVIPGAIGIEKGYEIVLACARDAANRRLAITFALVGHSCDDARLLDTGWLSLTGAYAEADALGLIEAQEGDIAWVPSIWPETWCYTLTLAWQAGLPAVAFDIGAPAERIKASGRGWLLPLGLPPAQINDALIAAGRSARG